MQESLQPSQTETYQCEKCTYERRTFGNKYLEKSFNTMEKLIGSKSNDNKIPVWIRAQYLKRRSQRY
jgi:hypothetical protein